MTITFSPELLVMLAINLVLMAVGWGTLSEQVRHLKEKSADHDDMRDVVTELRTEMKLLREAIANQPNVVGGVVSETIRATLQFVRSGAKAHAA